MKASKRMKAPEGCNAFNREPLLHGKGKKNEVGYTNDGWLNLYALGCGYMEKIEIAKANISVSLWLEGVFHVRVHDHGQGKRICWESFDTVDESREFFAKKVKELQDEV